MAISFKNSPKTFFFISLISLVAVSTGAGFFNRVYLATKKSEDSLGEVRFGTNKSLKDLFDEKEIHFRIRLRMEIGPLLRVVKDGGGIGIYEKAVP